MVVLVTIRNKQLKRRLEIAQSNNTLELNPYQDCGKDLEVSEDDFKKQLGDTPHLNSMYDHPIYESIDDSSSQQNESDDEILEEPKNCEDYDYESMKGCPMSGDSPISQ